MVLYDRERYKTMYQYPADYDMAQLHVRANSFGYLARNKHKPSEDPYHICPCCEKPI